LTSETLNEKRMPMSVRTYTMKALLTQARERFGADAARFKTRQELLDALGFDVDAPQVSSASSVSPKVVVLRDFFLPREKL
jgi:hypothetical protein